MAEKQGAGKGKKGRKIGNNLAKCAKYKARNRLEQNKERGAARMAWHLLKAKARKYKNTPPEEFNTTENFDKCAEAYAKVQKIRKERGIIVA